MEISCLLLICERYRDQKGRACRHSEHEWGKPKTSTCRGRLNMNEIVEEEGFEDKVDERGKDKIKGTKESLKDVQNIMNVEEARRRRGVRGYDLSLSIRSPIWRSWPAALGESLFSYLVCSRFSAFQPGVLHR